MLSSVPLFPTFHIVEKELCWSWCQFCHWYCRQLTHILNLQWLSTSKNNRSASIIIWGSKVFLWRLAVISYKWKLTPSKRRKTSQSNSLNVSNNTILAYTTVCQLPIGFLFHTHKVCEEVHVSTSFILALLGCSYNLKVPTIMRH